MNGQTYIKIVLFVLLLLALLLPYPVQGAEPVIPSALCVKEQALPVLLTEEAQDWGGLESGEVYHAEWLNSLYVVDGAYHMLGLTQEPETILLAVLAEDTLEVWAVGWCEPSEFEE